MSTKQELLRRLAQAGDTSLSGQELAGSLGVSRAAVHKAAAALRAGCACLRPDYAADGRLCGA